MSAPMPIGMNVGGSNGHLVELTATDSGQKTTLRIAVSSVRSSVSREERRDAPISAAALTDPARSTAVNEAERHRLNASAHRDASASGFIFE